MTGQVGIQVCEVGRIRGLEKILSSGLPTLYRRAYRLVNVPLDESIGETETRSVGERLVDHRPNPEDQCSDSELSARLTHFHTQLSPTLRRTFQLRDVDGLSIRETARILGIPIGTVKTHSARARKKLMDLMRRSLRTQSRSLRVSGELAEGW
jgi:RNA polymerase sigma factor (sigma-70 family)